MQVQFERDVLSAPARGNICNGKLEDLITRYRLLFTNIFVIDRSINYMVTKFSQLLVCSHTNLTAFLIYLTQHQSLDGISVMRFLLGAL